MRQKQNLANSLVTGLWLLTDSLWAFDFNQSAITSGIILSTVQLLICIFMTTSLTAMMEFSILSWIVFNTIWICNDTFPDRLELKVSMFAMCIISWLTFYFTIRTGLVSKRGKIWK